MGILSLLLEGKKIKFSISDNDSYEYDQDMSKLLQIINGEMTGFELDVLEVNEFLIIIDWGDDLTSTLYEDDLIFVD
jgi:hypothetical protein